MRKHINSLIVNSGLLISGSLTLFSGLLIQVKYHMGNHGNIDESNLVFGVGYHGWSDIHKISIIILSIVMIFHIYLHWKWYKIVFKKRLFAKNIQVLTLSAVFALVAITGFIPWYIDSVIGNETLRKTFIEIHDKLSLILFIYLLLHVIKRLKWFLTAFEKTNRKHFTQ